MSKIAFLQKIAAELNTEFGLDPKIDESIKDPSELTKAIKKELGDELYDVDKPKLSTSTWDYLTGPMGITPKETPSQTKAPAAKKAKEEKVEKKKAATKKAQETKKKKEAKEPRVTKKSVIIDLLEKRKSGATLDEMAKAIVDAGVDPDFDKNKSTAKLWLRKLGFPVKKDEKTGKYTKA